MTSKLPSWLFLLFSLMFLMASEASATTGERTVTSVAQLGSANFGAYAIINMESYYEGGGGAGGGQLYQTTCTVNNINCFGDLIAVHTFKRLYPTWDVAEGGLKADGTTVNTTLLSNFMTAAVAANQGQIYFSGTSLGAAWRVGTLTVPANLKLVCLSSPYAAPSNAVFTTYTPTIILTTASGITFGNNGTNGSTGCSYVTTALWTATAPTSWRDDYNRGVNFSGTALTCTGDNGCEIRDGSIMGFAQGISLKSRNAYINNMTIDATSCWKMRAQGAGQIRVTNSTCVPSATRSVGGVNPVYAQINIPLSGFTDDSGTIKATFTSTCSDSNNCPQNGDVVYIVNPSNTQSAAGKWTVSNASTSSFDLSGSTSAFIAGYAQTGTTTTGSVEVTGLTTNLSQIKRSQKATGTCISGTATINAVLRSQGVIELDSGHPATSTGSCTITITDGGSPLGVTTAAISAAGSGYSPGNILTVSGGTATAPAQLLVTTVDGSGAVTGVSVSDGGLYTVLPANPASVTGGDGSGATFNLSSGSVVTLEANQRTGAVFDIAGVNNVKIENISSLNHSTGATFGAGTSDVYIAESQLNGNTALEDDTQQGLVFTGTAKRVIFNNGALYYGYANIVDQTVSSANITCNAVTNSTIGGGSNEGYQTTILEVDNPNGLGNAKHTCFSLTGNISRTQNAFTFVTADTNSVTFANNNFPVTQSYCVAGSGSVLYGSGNNMAANSCLPTIPAATLPGSGITTVNGTSCTIGSSCTVSPYLLAQSGAAVSAPVDTTEDTLATITVPANSMGANGCVEIKTMWTTTNSANVKTMRVRFGGTVYYGFGATATAANTSVARVCNTNATNAQVGGYSAHSFGSDAQTGSLVTTAVDTTSAATILITGQKASSGETITLNSYSVMISPAN